MVGTGPSCSSNRLVRQIVFGQCGGSLGNYCIDRIAGGRCSGGFLYGNRSGRNVVKFLGIKRIAKLPIESELAAVGDGECALFL